MQALLYVIVSLSVLERVRRGMMQNAGPGLDSRHPNRQFGGQYRVAVYCHERLKGNNKAFLLDSSQFLDTKC